MVKHNLELPRLYGPNYSNMNPGTDNIVTLPKITQVHHCRRCDSDPKKSCWDELDLGFCTALIKDDDGIWVFCGYRFDMNSAGGCGIHKFNQGHNAFLKDASRGLPAEIPNFIPWEQPEWLERQAKLAAAAEEAQNKKQGGMRGFLNKFKGKRTGAKSAPALAIEDRIEVRRNPRQTAPGRIVEAANAAVVHDANFNDDPKNWKKVEDKKRAAMLEDQRKRREANSAAVAAASAVSGRLNKTTGKKGQAGIYKGVSRKRNGGN